MHTYFKFSIAFNYVIMLHYIYIKFRAQNFHYVSKTPLEILSQDFISEFHLLFQQRIHSDFWWCYSFNATLSAPSLAQVACTPGKCYGTSEFLTNPFCIEFIFIQFLYCLFILTMLKCIQKVLSKTYGLCIFSISSYNQCPCWRNQWPYRPYYKEAV